MKRVGICALAFLLGAATARAEAFYAYGTDSLGADGQLFLFDADSGETTAIGPIQSPAPLFRDLATSPDGQVFGLVSAGGSIHLYRIDTATGAASQVGSTGVASTPAPPKITFDEAGTLWLANGQSLYSVDPATASAFPAGILPRTILALAERDGQLFAVTHDGVQWDIYRLEELDPATATLTLRSSFLFEHGITDAAFDAYGRLRLFSRGGGLLVYTYLTFYLVADLDAVSPVETFSHAYPFQSLLAGIPAIAEQPTGPVVDVPAAGIVGKWLLACALIGAAFAFLRRT